MLLSILLRAFGMRHRDTERRNVLPRADHLPRLPLRRLGREPAREGIANFTRSVIGCIDANFCDQLFIFQFFKTYMICALLHWSKLDVDQHMSTYSPILVNIC